MKIRINPAYLPTPALKPAKASYEAQADALDARARIHESAGNDLLAKWMRESAAKNRTDARKADRTLASMSVKRTRMQNPPTTIREGFARQWYALEESVPENFICD